VSNIGNSEASSLIERLKKGMSENLGNKYPELEILVIPSTQHTHIECVYPKYVVLSQEELEKQNKLEAQINNISENDVVDVLMEKIYSEKISGKT
jgi:hypothetical protein